MKAQNANHEATREFPILAILHNCSPVVPLCTLTQIQVCPDDGDGMTVMVMGGDDGDARDDDDGGDGDDSDSDDYYHGDHDNPFPRRRNNRGGAVGVLELLVLTFDLVSSEVYLWRETEE